MSLAVWAAVLLGAAVWTVAPPAGERRLARPVRRALPGWLAPVPDALGSRPRGLAAGALAAAVALWTSSLGWVSLGLGAIVGVVGFVALGRVTPASRARRTAALVAALPQACDLLAVAVAAGLPLRVAVDVVADAVGGPVGEVLCEVAARVRLGASEAEAWAELEDDPAVGSMAREIARTVSTGLGLSTLLRGLAVESRRAAAAAALVRARQVGVRSVMPLMLAFLPAFVLLGIVPIFGGIIAKGFP